MRDPVDVHYEKLHAELEVSAFLSFIRVFQSF